MFSTFLQENREKLKELLSELQKEYKYVSILGSDVKTMNYMANKMATSIDEGRDSERGFVVKMSNGKAFFEYSFDVLEEDVKDFAKKIIESVKLQDPIEEVNTGLIEEEPLKKDFVREGDLDQFSNQELLKKMIEIKDATLAKDEHIVNAITFLMTLDVSKLFLSKKKELSQNYTWVNGFIIAYYVDGRMVSVREGAYSNKMKDVLDKLPTLVDALIDKAKHLVNAKPVVPGVYDVITHPSIAGLIAHEAFGHGVEMDQFVKDRAIAKGYINKYVASPLVNMRDGAASALSVASYFFDDDGILAHDTLIIKDGILQTGICDLVSSRELGTNPTGNGRRQSYKNKSYTRMTNTFFCPGKDKLEDMIKSVKHGYMIFETNNGMEDPKNWAIQCVAEYGIEIVDGKLTENYVSPVVMSGYVPDLLKSISMVSDDFMVIGAGQCGKGYKEWVRVSDGGPALKARVKLS
ncbi:MAG: TldD/PmbA family protein [Bacilli bacterium]|nr:TldD/PmbA family protein [Bacilli bacterium]